MIIASGLVLAYSKLGNWGDKTEPQLSCEVLFDDGGQTLVVDLSPEAFRRIEASPFPLRVSLTLVDPGTL